MNYLNTILTNDIIRALGWTLLHSLWQVAIVAIVLGLVLLALKRSSSATRYYVSAGAMIIVLLLAVITFVGEYSTIQKNKTGVQKIQASNMLADNYTKEVKTTANAELQSDFSEKIIAYFDKHLPLIVLIWQMGVLVLLLKLIGGLAYSQRLKSYRTQSLPANWQSTIDNLSYSMGIKKTIKLLESAIIKAPVVIGYFKPVILFPIGAIAGLSQDQVEVILAHELAHIKRNDYLINVFQSVIEVLFFFHPAIWWISANIRSERENACDDIALSVNNDSLVLARALTNLEFLNHKTPTLAAAFSGNKASLINRVKRIVNQPNTLPTFKEGFITASILFAGLLIMSFSAKMVVSPDNMPIIPDNATELIKNIPKTNLTNTFTATDDTIVTINQNKNITYKIKGTVYRLEFNDNKELKKFLVNGDEIPKNNWEKYQKDIDLGFDFMKEHELAMIAHKKEMKKHEEEMRKHEFEMQAHDKEMQKHDLEIESHDKELGKHDLEMDKKHENLRKHEITLLKKEVEYQKQALILSEKKKDLQANSDDYLEKSKELQIHEKKLLEQKKELIRHKKELSIHIAELKEHQKAMEKRKQEMVVHEKEMKIHEKEMKEQEEKMRIIEELVVEMKKDKLIDKDAVSYKVHFFESSLIINGKKQSDKVFKKYKSLFDEKAKGKYKLDVQLNVNPNFYIE